MKISKHAAMAATLALVFCAASAHAQFKLPGGLGGSSSSSSDDGGDAVAAQDSLVKSFVSSQSEVLAAQVLLAKAYDLNDQVALLEAQQKALQSGAVDQDALKKTVEISSNANREISAQQAQKSELSAQGKQYYEESLPHFARGVAGTRVMVGEAQKFTAAVKSSANGGLAGAGAAMTKLKAGMYVAKETPSYSKSLFDTFKKTVSISKSNGVKVPSDATQALGDL